MFLDYCTEEISGNSCGDTDALDQAVIDGIIDNCVQDVRVRLQIVLSKLVALCIIVPFIHLYINLLRNVGHGFGGGHC